MAADFSLSNLFYDLGRWAGLAGFAALAFLIFSGDTARFFDRYFGLDRIIKFQRKFSLITAIFVLSHPWLFIASSGSAAGYLLPDFAGLPLALGITAFYIFIIVMVASRLYKRISYAGWQYLHILTYVLFFFSIYHAFYWGSDSGLKLTKIFYAVSLIAVTSGLVYRMQYKIKRRSAGRFYLKKIVRETNDTFTLIVTPEKKLKFKAGQFCFLRLNQDRLYANHPFSIASSPEEMDLHFTVKKTGRFTAAAAELKKGDEVIVEGPFGKFFERDSLPNLVFIAGGVGIAPFMSLLKDRSRQNKTRNLLLLYGAKTWDDIIFRVSLDEIKALWFTKVYVLSQARASAENLYEVGYIDGRLIKRYVKNPSGSLFYICGPEALKNNAKKTLAELGVKKRQIFIEDFFW